MVFILNIHGVGSVGQWQRHYFPAFDYKDKYRLVVATPTAATERPIAPGVPGVRMWVAEADDAHLQNIADLVVDAFGPKNIKAFWLAGHSQGGVTSQRIVCSPYFANKVDGVLSLSGGRIGRRARSIPRFGPPKADGSPPDPRPAPAVMNATTSRPASSATSTRPASMRSWPCRRLRRLAEKYGCAARVEKPDLVDDKAGYVWDYARQGYPVWGMKARPGTSKTWVYPKCKDDRLVADVVRIDKGHTEGLEPQGHRGTGEDDGRRAGRQGRGRRPVGGTAAWGAPRGGPTLR